MTIYYIDFLYISDIMIYEPGLIKNINHDMEDPYDFLEPLSYIKVNHLQFTCNQRDSKRRKKERGEIDIYADKTEEIYEAVEAQPPDLPPRKPLVLLSRPRILLPGNDSNATGTNTKGTTPLTHHQKQTFSVFPSRNYPKQEKDECEMKDLHTPNVDMYMDCRLSSENSCEKPLSTIPTNTRSTLLEKVCRFGVSLPFIQDGSIFQKTKVTSRVLEYKKKKPIASLKPEVLPKPLKQQCGTGVPPSGHSMGVTAKDTKVASTTIGHPQKNLISEVPSKVKPKPSKQQRKAKVPLPGNSDGTIAMRNEKISATEDDTIGMKSQLHLKALKQLSIAIPRMPGFKSYPKEQMSNISDESQPLLTSGIHSYANVLQTAAISPMVVAKCENQNSQSVVALHENNITQSGPAAQQVIGAPQQSRGASTEAISNLHQVPKDITDLTVSQIGDCLRLLKLDKHVDDFEEMQIDGALLTTLSAEMLNYEFGMSLLKATKLKQFCQGWRPKEANK